MTALLAFIWLASVAFTGVIAFVLGIDWGRGGGANTDDEERCRREWG